MTTFTARQIEEMANHLDQTVFFVGNRKVTRRVATNLFNMVAPQDNWKNPIDTTVFVYDQHTLEALKRAVTFFTGSVPTVCPTGLHQYRVRADGYYAAIGA